MHIHELNGDARLGFFDRIRYLFQNFFRNIRYSPHYVRPTYYRPDHIDDHLFLASPLRAYAETFMTKTLPEIFTPPHIRVLDIGCGSGRYSDLLSSAGYTGEYVGIDINDSFQYQLSETQSFKRSFQSVSVHEFSSENLFDLIISMSALEHIEHDDSLIDHLEQFLTDRGIQLHIVPGACALPLYLWHGFRQYRLHDLEARFGTDNVHIFALGGCASYSLHFLFITLGEMIFRLPLRRWLKGLYKSLHRICIRLDRYMLFFPAGYIVLRQSIISQNSATVIPTGEAS